MCVHVGVYEGVCVGVGVGLNAGVCVGACVGVCVGVYWSARVCVVVYAGCVVLRMGYMWVNVWVYMLVHMRGCTLVHARACVLVHLPVYMCGVFVGVGMGVYVVYTRVYMWAM